MLIGVVAMTDFGLMGKGDGLPWHIPDDLRFFRNLTKGKTLVAGKRTWESMPRMEDRNFIVYTRDHDLEQTEQFKSVDTVEEIVNLAFSDEKYYLIGGAYMFKLFGHLCDYFYVTKVKEDEYTTFDGDVYFPIKSLSNYFELESAVPHTDETTGLELVFELYYKRKRG